jgi:hypothetical protein
VFLTDTVKSKQLFLENMEIKRKAGFVAVKRLFLGLARLNAARQPPTGI